VQRSQFDILSSTFEFVDASELPVLTLNGFVQRIIRLPEPFWSILFGRDEVTSALNQLSDVAVGEEGWSFLNGGHGIWGRALAHLALLPSELANWYLIPGGTVEKTRWLVEHIAARRRRDRELSSA
jgi:hypothetical protein